ncbi:DUF362 domain-containing protein [Haloimpatiens sp. FM7330]|uniref:DUF362 domain-containing protein n=1 Tax=Haloimpatiens sp. FM7330 TaxID=3298610 RepID=UPI00363ED523
MVAPKVIDENTHGEGLGAAICTEWPLIASLMRWFHDKLDISYSQMAIGEASTATFILSCMYSKTTEKNITTEAIIEGRSNDFYGGWGFYFVRKYLAEHHPVCHRDNPMNGYEDSVAGRYFPPGTAGNRLMVYDLNKVEDDITKGRTILVPGGKNFNHITLHKVIIGGDPNDKNDLIEYPGCILVNVPKLKMHAQDLITNAIKNLGIGLYPSQCALEKEENETSWKYAYPPTSNPSLKGKLPHSPWVLKMDENTHLPIRDDNGKYIASKTAGFSGTQSDVIRAVQNQNIFMIHIVDAINMINISHDPNGKSVRVPEGYVLSSLDCVALDLFCARYCFKTVPMLKALKLKQKNKWVTEFVHDVPVAKINGTNISTESGYDSPLFRYNLYRDAEERGVGQQKYYVVGWDSLTETPLASLRGHLGRIDNAKFLELITQTMYYNPTTFIHDLQKTAFSYAKACDSLTESTIFKKLMDNFDENNDGVIDYDEKGRGIETAQFCILAYAVDLQITIPYGMLKKSFIEPVYLLKNGDKNWNPEGHDFVRELWIVKKIALAYEMSKSKSTNTDLFFPQMTYGKGMWPSWQTVTYILITSALYGSQSPKYVNLNSLYGFVFQYADKILNAGGYTGSIDENISVPNSINKYFEAVFNGANPLNFKFYVPMGYESLVGVKIPNVEETDDPQKILSVHFKEIW